MAGSAGKEEIKKSREAKEVEEEKLEEERQGGKTGDNRVEARAESGHATAMAQRGRKGGYSGGRSQPSSFLLQRDRIRKRNVPISRPLNNKSNVSKAQQHLVLFYVLATQRALANQIVRVTDSAIPRVQARDRWSWGGVEELDSTCPWLIADWLTR